MIDRDVGATVIMFIPCGVVSFNPKDVRERHCARCHRFIKNRFFDLTGTTAKRTSRDLEPF
jgi:hypothetical protein